MSRQLSLFQFVASSTNSSPSPNPDPIDYPDLTDSSDPADSSNPTDSSDPTVLGSDIDPSHSSNPSPSSSCSIAINDIALSVTSPPVRPIHITFPVTYFSGKARSFNPNWFHQYNWLEYSITKDAAFCYPCWLFGTPSASTSRPERAFTTSGFRDWKHATGSKGSLISHEKCLSHKESVIAWGQYKASTQRGSVADRLGNLRSEQIKQNKHYMLSVCDILRFCCTQEIALRGHDESSQSLKRGNFLELMNLMARHDPIVSDRLQNGPQNAKYTSPLIQNTIIGIMASKIRQKICSSVQNAGYYSIMVDETKDQSKQEQLSVVVRYIDHDSSSGNCTATIQERFLTFFPAENLNAASLFQYILTTLEQYNLDPKMIVSQGYDGASVMRGHCSGLQHRMREIAPYAVYIHCRAHVLNLVLVDCAKNNLFAAEFFSLIQSLYTFMSTSKAHVIFLQKQQEIHPGKPTRELQRLSDTRWACRSMALDAIASTFDAIIATLEVISNDTDKFKAIEAIGLHNQVQEFRFLASLTIFQRLMSVTKGLSDQLQSKTNDLSHAAELVSSTISTLRNFRTDKTWERTYQYIKDVAALNNIEPSSLESSHKRKRKHPRRLEDSVVFESTGSRDDVNCSQSLKFEIFFPIIDHILSELDRRFSNDNLMLMKSLNAFNPSSPDFLDPSSVSSFAALYSLNDDNVAIELECLLAKRTLSAANNVESVSEAYSHLLNLKSAFPSLTKLFQIALTLVVSTASCERSFSALGRIKSYLRTTMTNQKLTDISVISIERDLCSGPSFLEDTVRTFAGSDNNRTIVLI